MLCSRMIGRSLSISQSSSGERKRSFLYPNSWSIISYRPSPVYNVHTWPPAQSKLVARYRFRSLSIQAADQIQAKSSKHQQKTKITACKRPTSNPLDVIAVHALIHYAGTSSQHQWCTRVLKRARLHRQSASILLASS